MVHVKARRKAYVYVAISKSYKNRTKIGLLLEELQSSNIWYYGPGGGCEWGKKVEENISFMTLPTNAILAFVDIKQNKIH